MTVVAHKKLLENTQIISDKELLTMTPTFHLFTCVCLVITDRWM